jgi:hypothetical protein
MAMNATANAIEPAMGIPSSGGRSKALATGEARTGAAMIAAPYETPSVRNPNPAANPPRRAPAQENQPRIARTSMSSSMSI